MYRIKVLGFALKQAVYHNDDCVRPSALRSRAPRKSSYQARESGYDKGRVALLTFATQARKAVQFTRTPVETQNRARYDNY